MIMVVAVAAEVVAEAEETHSYHVNNNLRVTRQRIRRKVLRLVHES